MAKPYNFVPVPTDQEIANAAMRREMADADLDELQNAIDACGPGATAYGKWRMEDKLGIEPTRTAYCCLRPTYTGWQPKFEDMTRMTPDQHPGYEVMGVRYFPFRYTEGFQAITVANPMTAEQLAEARAKREQKRFDAEVESLALFADQVVAEVEETDAR